MSKGHGLKLNKGKCVAIAMKNGGDIHFEDRTPSTKEFEATYLGNEINKTVNIQLMILKCRKCGTHGSNLSHTGRASKKRKLIIYDVIIRSKLLYGLEIIHLTQAMSKSWMLSTCVDFGVS